MKDEQDAIDIIAKAYEQMKEEGVASYRCGKPNLSELARRSGMSRKKAARLFHNGNGEIKAVGCKSQLKRA